MPEIFRFFGFSFFFYSKEHDPLHVHVEGNGGDENADIIIAQWNKHFNH